MAAKHKIKEAAARDGRVAPLWTNTPSTKCPVKNARRIATTCGEVPLRPAAQVVARGGIPRRDAVGGSASGGVGGGSGAYGSSGINESKAEKIFDDICDEDNPAAANMEGKSYV